MFYPEMTDMEAQEYFDNFFEEVFTELEDRVIIASYVLLCAQMLLILKKKDHIKKFDSPLIYMVIWPNLEQ